MVYGLESYNDSITDAFRSEAIRLHSNDGARFSLAYIDRDRQSDFISVFELIQGSSKNCANGHKSHHVRYLYTFPLFCYGTIYWDSPSTNRTSLI